MALLGSGVRPGRGRSERPLVAPPLHTRVKTFQLPHTQISCKLSQPAVHTGRGQVEIVCVKGACLWNHTWLFGFFSNYFLKRCFLFKLKKIPGKLDFIDRKSSSRNSIQKIWWYNGLPPNLNVMFRHLYRSGFVNLATEKKRQRSIWKYIFNSANFQVVYKVWVEIAFKRPNLLLQGFLQRIFQIALSVPTQLWYCLSPQDSRQHSLKVHSFSFIS